MFEGQCRLDRPGLQIPNFRLLRAYAKRGVHPLRAFAGIRQKIIFAFGRAAVYEPGMFAGPVKRNVR